MKSVVLSPLAQSDVSDIWDYTVEAWGQKQAVAYTKGIRDACKLLNSEYGLGRPVDVRTGYFKYPVGEHFIYYRLSRNEVLVTRILHKRMDVNLHL